MTEDEAQADIIARLITLGMDDEAAEIVILMTRALSGMQVAQVASLLALTAGVLALKTGAGKAAELMRQLAQAVEDNPPDGAKP